MKNLKYLILTVFLVIINMVIMHAQSNKDTIITTLDNTESEVKLEINFTWGKAFNHPTFVVWIENLDGTFIKTLYATESIATGTWPYGEVEPGKWKPESGHQVRPAALPYWFHKRSSSGKKPRIPSHGNPLPDAITGATPKNNLILNTKPGSKIPNKFRVLVEINQTWDWNNYWTNNRFPDDTNYKTSAQPAIIYAVRINLNDKIDGYFLNPIGHSHYSGKDGLLYTDLSTLTTALDIIKKIKVKVKR